MSPDAHTGLQVVTDVFSTQTMDSALERGDVFE